MRKPRYYYESDFYHIMVQGDEKKYIFKSYRNKEKYLYYLKHNAFRNGIEIIAYCIMDIHAHILLFCPEIERISKMMSQCNTSFGMYYSKKQQRDFSSLDSQIREITDILDEDIKSILEDSNTITRFLDDEYSKEDKEEVFVDIAKQIRYNKNDDDIIGEMYLKLKENCRINDTEIAKLLGIPRTTMNEKLNKIGLKNGVM